MRYRTRGMLLLAALLPIIGFNTMVSAQEDGAGDGAADETILVETTAEVVYPEPASALEAVAPSDGPSPEELEAQLQDLRDTMALEANEGHGGAPAAAASEADPPQVVEAAQSETLSIIANRQNTIADNIGAGSTLAEPAAAADGQNVIYAGNTYVSRSTNAGVGWTQEALPAGPANSPNVCCDSDVVYDPVTDTTFNIVLYLNAGATNGDVRIFVRQGSQSTVDCTYLYNGGGTNDLPDYPHIALTDQFLFLSSNNIDSVTGWTGATMRRYNTSQMSQCQGVTVNTFNYTGAVGQRIHTPVEGATDVMYWGSLDNATTFRLFAWPDSSGAVSQTTRTVNASAFNNPDCRGGTNNADFIERGTSWSIAGFRMRGTVAGNFVYFLWHSSPIGGQTQAHLRGIAVSTTGANGIGAGILAQPVVWNNGFCLGYPALSGNPYGDVAASWAWGGQAGGGGNAAQGAVAVDDASTAGIFFSTFNTTAVGTHNRADGRFGDYFTVRRSSRCRGSWVGTNYALNGGTSTTNVNARYIEFQSSFDQPCPVVNK